MKREAYFDLIVDLCLTVGDAAKSSTEASAESSSNTLFSYKDITR